MKTISRLLPGAVWLAVFLSAGAQTPPAKEGCVRIVNAVTRGAGALVVEIDGQNLKPAGYKPGAVTGGVTVAAGARSVKFSSAGLESGVTKPTVAPGETVTLVACAEPVPAPQGAPARWRIKILRIRQQPPEVSRQATFANVSSHPELSVEIRDPAGGWTAVSVKRLGLARSPIRQSRGYVPLRTAAARLASIPVAARGNYLVVLFDGPDGGLRSLSFHDRGGSE
jgi:hypothetical protein